MSNSEDHNIIKQTTEVQYRVLKKGVEYTNEEVKEKIKKVIDDFGNDFVYFYWDGGNIEVNYKKDEEE